MNSDLDLDKSLPSRPEGLAENERLLALEKVVLGLTSTLELEEVLHRVAELAQSLPNAADAHIFLYDQARDQLTMVARHWPPERKYPPPEPRRNGVTYTVARTGVARFIEDAAQDPAYAHAPLDRRPGAFACLPLLKGNRVLGTLNLGFWTPRRFDAETRSFLDLMARQAAIAIDNAQLYAASEQRSNAMAALYDISLEINGELELQPLLEDIIKRSSELLDAEGGFLFLWDEEEQMLKLFAAHGLDERYVSQTLRLGEGISGRVAQARHPIALEDYHSWPGRSQTFMDVPFGPVISAPLLWNDRLLGTLGLAMPVGNPRSFTPDEIRLLEQLAAQAAVAIQNARLFDQSRRHEMELDRRVRELALVNEISHQVNSFDIDEVQQTALDQLASRFGAAYCALGLYDPGTETVKVTAVRPISDPILGNELRVENNVELATAIRERRAVHWKDDPFMVSDHPTRNYFRRRGTKQLIILPLIVQDRAIGFMGIDPGEREVREDEISLWQTVANQIAIAMENARLAQMAIGQARIERELQLARSVQAGYLARKHPTIPGWSIAGCWEPASEVSGDFYDFIEFPGNRLGLVIGDVSGKGMPAAIVMATTRAVLRAVSSSTISPGAILERANDVLCQDMPVNMFVTCFLAILDPEDGRIRFANAGQNLPCHVGPKGTSKLFATGMPLGLMSAMMYEEKQISLGPGERVVFYSDGLVEAHNPQREMFGYARLARAAARPERGDELVQRTLQELADFVGPSSRQEDDVTVLVLERLATS